MPLYFMLLDADLFHGQIAPALTTSWKKSSFAPCLPLCSYLLPAARNYLERCHAKSDEPLLFQMTRGLRFDRHFWQLLAGEIFHFAATEIPEIQVMPETMLCLLAADRYRVGGTTRDLFSPIEQVHWGARDLQLGRKVYRPENAGYNDLPDVARLHDYLSALDPKTWSVDGLHLLQELTDESDRQEELELAREWLPALIELYDRCRKQRQIIICENL
jgi:hypothetical protein